MKIINEKGKLFGLINIVDFLVKVRPMRTSCVPILGVGVPFVTSLSTTKITSFFVGSVELTIRPSAH